MNIQRRGTFQIKKPGTDVADRLSGSRNSLPEVSSRIGKTQDFMTCIVVAIVYFQNSCNDAHMWLVTLK